MRKKKKTQVASSIRPIRYQYIKIALKGTKINQLIWFFVVVFSLKIFLIQVFCVTLV